jgi:hypothetical protein
MNARNFATLGLRVRLALTRFGWSSNIAGLLCILGVVSWVWGISRLNTTELQAQQRALSHAQQLLRASETAPHPVQMPPEERLADFYDALGDKRFAEQQIKTLFAIAKKAGLTLDQAAYQSGVDKNGRFHTYQIVIPVKGSYSAIRQFCKQTLLAIPFASLDEMSFKRDALASRDVEAQLRFTLYLSDLRSPARHSEVTTSAGAPP